ncbi:class D sortase [Paenibacillus allorhizosphaerae]|nr:class D sortase [Paenibacillus allorhizosphaerae]
MARQIPFLLCIVVGTILLVYPTLKDRYDSYRQQQILAEWQQSLLRLDNVTLEENIEADVPAPSISVAEAAEAKPVQAAPLHVETKTLTESVPDQAEALLVIDKIDLKLPVLTNATEKNLQLSVASMANTGKAGDIGNYAIAGHRNLTYGKNFNRLDEVDVGDRIKVNTRSKRYEYEVQEKLYVLPEEVWVLKGNGKDRVITLITCHPLQNATHRLIIKGKIVEKQS